VDQAFTSTIYAADSPYSRPAGGDEENGPRLTPDVLRELHRSLLDPRRMALVVGGDLAGLDAPRLVESVLGSVASPGGAEPATGDSALSRVPDRPSITRSSASTTAPARSRPSCGSAMSASRGEPRTSTPSP